MSAQRIIHMVAVLAALAACQAVLAAEPAALHPAADWLRADGGNPVWGVRGGLAFGLHAPRGPTRGGPRGLIHLRYPVEDGGPYQLVNFLAVEPIVRGKKGFSEMETSGLDRRQGKVFQSGNDARSDRPDPGVLRDLPSGVRQLEVVVRVEKFQNGAHVRLTVAQRGDRPDELTFTVHAEPDSAPLDYCILTATMGNRARCRQLWLKDQVVSSLKLDPGFKDDGFTRDFIFPRERMLATATGDLLVALTTDETDPAKVFPVPGTRQWYYAGAAVTQYWKMPKDEIRSDLHVRLNARAVYFNTNLSIPGGISFENFELRQRFRDGQRFIFGITRKPPAELGYGVPQPFRR